MRPFTDGLKRTSLVRRHGVQLPIVCGSGLFAFCLQRPAPTAALFGSNRAALTSLIKIIPYFDVSCRV